MYKCCSRTPTVCIASAAVVTPDVALYWLLYNSSVTWGHRTVLNFTPAHNNMSCRKGAGWARYDRGGHIWVEDVSYNLLFYMVVRHIIVAEAY